MVGAVMPANPELRPPALQLQSPLSPPSALALGRRRRAGEAFPQGLELPQADVPP